MGHDIKFDFCDVKWEFVNLEHLEFRGMGIIKGSLFEGNVSAD